MSPTAKRRTNIIYAGMWLLAICLYMLHEVGDMRHPQHNFTIIELLVKSILAIAPYFILFVVNNFVLMPRLLMKHRQTAYYLSVLLLIALIGVFQYIQFTHAEHAMIHPAAYPSAHSGIATPPRGNRLLPMPFVHDLIYSLLTIGANIIVSMAMNQSAFILEREQLVSANTRNQLEQLKTQINPHFYMNMLNSIHGLIEVDPAKAQDMIIEMSRLMRYVIYDSAEPRIPLSAEVAFLEDYMRLMRMRFPENKVAITSRFPSADKMAGVRVAPLMFLVFIENAFKHGVSYRSESYINVTIDVTDQYVVFRCSNSQFPRPNAAQTHSGVGLANVSQRIDLIYSNRARLDIDRADTSFIVHLSIPIHETENTNS